jgi:hypothetical protein
MDLSKVLEQLRRELVHLDAAILNLERLQARAVRHGRPRSVTTGLLKAQLKPPPTGHRQARRGRVID